MQSWGFAIGKEVYWSMEFDIGCFEKYRENNRLEVKKAKGGLPVSLWETYSSMSNCHGGTIILGIIEKDDGSFATTGLKDVEKLKKDFWNTINNNRKVSANLLTDTDIESYEVNNDVILVIRVPRAPREFKPVYINDDLFGGTFRRNGEGDYHCTKSEVRAMLRDQTEETSDMKVLEDFTFVIWIWKRSMLTATDILPIGQNMCGKACLMKNIWNGLEQPKRRNLIKSCIPRQQVF